MRKKNAQQSKLKQGFYRWIDSRLSTGAIARLSQRNIYILPTRYGFLLLAIIALILVASTNYQNNLGFMAGFIILALGMLSIFYTYRNVRNLTITSLAPRPVFMGETAQLPLKVSNPLAHFRGSVGFGVHASDMSFTNVPENDSTVINIMVTPERRGWYQPPRLLCRSIYPFGIFKVWSWFKTNQAVLVYPRPVKCPDPLFQMAHNDEESGEPEKGHEDFYGLREYQKGDAANHILWKAYARERGILVREFEEKRGTKAHLHWDSVAHYGVELALCYLTEAIISAEQQGAEYSLSLPDSTLHYTPGKQHYSRCLKALALYGIGSDASPQNTHGADDE